MCEGAALPVPTLTHIRGEHFVALPGVLLAHEEVHTLILAGDGRGDLDFLPRNWIRVEGDDSWLRVFTKCRVSSASSPNFLNPTGLNLVCLRLKGTLARTMIRVNGHERWTDTNE